MVSPASRDRRAGLGRYGISLDRCRGNPTAGTTVWNIGDAANDYYAPSTSSFMVNYRVADLTGLLAVLREEGCNVLEKTDDSEYGKFGWVIDPDGNKVELWEPPAGS